MKLQSRYHEVWVKVADEINSSDLCDVLMKSPWKQPVTELSVEPNRCKNIHLNHNNSSCLRLFHSVES